MSPEIIMGENFDLPTDVYSLGIIFIEILTRIVVGAKVYSRQAPVFTPDPDAVRRHASPGCPPDFIDLALQCCRFAPVDRPTLPEVLLRLRAIELKVTDAVDADYKCSAQPFRREGKRAMPLFDFSSDDEAEAHIDDQLTPREDAEEKVVYQALAEVDIVIDGTGPSLDLVSSPAKTLADESTDIFYNTASEMRCESLGGGPTCLTSTAYDLLNSEEESSDARPSSLAIPGPIPCTYPEDEEEASSTRTVKGAPEKPPNEPSSPESPREASLRLDMDEQEAACNVPPLPTPRASIDGHPSHRFTSLTGAADVLHAKRIPSSCED
jgi:LIM domain kinase 1